MSTMERTELRRTTIEKLKPRELETVGKLQERLSEFGVSTKSSPVPAEITKATTIAKAKSKEELQLKSIGSSEAAAPVAGPAGEITSVQYKDSAEHPTTSLAPVQTSPGDTPSQTKSSPEFPKVFPVPAKTLFADTRIFPDPLKDLSSRAASSAQLKTLAEIAGKSEKKFSTIEETDMNAKGGVVHLLPETRVLDARHCKDTDHYSLKIIVVGDPGVGKTSLIRRYTENCFLGTYKSTIGLDYFCKEVDTHYGPVSLRIHDIAGQDRTTYLSRSFYRKSDGAMVCYDVTDPKTFRSVPLWTSALDEAVENLPRILIGNKCDLKFKREMSPKEMLKFSRDNRFGVWSEVSAKTGHFVSQAFMELISMMVEREDAWKTAEEEKDLVNLGKKKTSKCVFGSCS